ncbi:MAG: MBL fold metallo-hydrolase [Methanothrix sp.]|nr:MAG: MBL fold metallo-hydrolase [Methanothrix sp.]
MSIKLVTLSENTASMAPAILAEHGFSVYLETNGTRLIFDTGQSISAAHNAQTLGVDLFGLPIALSHGHFDHTGGLESILKLTGPTSVYCHPDAFAPKYSERQGKLRYIGFIKSRQDYERMGASFCVSCQPQKLGPGIWLLGEIPRITDFEKPEENLRVLDPEMRIDPLLDDQAIAIDSDKGLVIVLGCAHSGLINTIEHARKITGVQKIASVIGGTHLGFSDANRAGSKARLDKTVQALREYDIGLLGVSHCTGPVAAARLSNEFGDRFVFNCAGTVIEI